MITFWSSEDIKAILIQLNNLGLPFAKYEFTVTDRGLKLLGSGSSANVYEAVSRKRRNSKAAIKVIGFGNDRVDPDSFSRSVGLQKNLRLQGENVVKIIDSTELRVWIKGEHEVIKAERINSHVETAPEGEFLHLQFILMEELVPVSALKDTDRNLIPYNPDMYDEKELLRLAYDIGLAIKSVHEEHLIHRDIKPENIFYDLRDRHYKLGDFGIVKMSYNGMASTVAFTKGYGAPEVIGGLDDKYDCTADIYSFGMTLYVLMNEFRFPGSSDYHPNLNQYKQGYAPPVPVNGSDRLVRIILKMLSFDPDDRYQSMEEVLNEFDSIRYGRRIKYQREHNSISLVLGTVFALSGAALWAMSFNTGVTAGSSVWMMIMCGLCILRGAMGLTHNDTPGICFLIIIMGIVDMITSGFSVLPLLLMIAAVFSKVYIGIFGSCVLIANITYRVLDHVGYSTGYFSNFRWMAVLLLTLAIIMLFMHIQLNNRLSLFTEAFLGRNLFWVTASVQYIFILLVAYILNDPHISDSPVLSRPHISEFTDWLMSWDPIRVGICGAAFCILWMLRDWGLSYIETHAYEILQKVKRDK